ncbi:MAG: MASE3 domain-containing protein [Bacillota bacterium]
MTKYIKSKIFNRSNLIWSVLIITLIFLSFDYFLVFHSLVELFSIITAAIIFVIALYSHSKNKNDFLIVLGIAYGFIGGFDLLHTLTYKGMGVFKNEGANLPTQLWIIARYMESISIVIALLYINKIKKYSIEKIAYFYSAFSILIIFTLYFNVFPVCYIEGEGLTLFKIISEYIISGILIYGLFLLYKNKDYFKKNIYNLISASIILTILSEISFTFYLDVFGDLNIIGHVFKLLSVLLIFKAIVKTGLKKPYDLLFRKIEIKNRELENFNKLYQTFIDANDNLIYLKDNKLHYIFANEAMAEFFNESKNEMIGKNDYQISGKEFADLRIKTDNIVKNENKRIVEKVEWNNKIYKITKFPVELLDGSFGVGAFIKDITEKMEIEKEFKLTQFSVDNAPVGVYWITSEGRFEYVNNKACEMLNYTKEELIGKKVSDIDTNYPEEKRSYFWKQLIKNNVNKIETEHKTKNGDIIPVQIINKYIRYKNKEYEFAFVQNISNRIEKEKEIKNLLYRDTLTDLYNRRFFEEEIKRLDTKRQLPLSIIMADINGLKIINDSLGHEKGDQLLINTSNLLKEVVREEDILARQGGDEFAVLLPKTKNEEAQKIVLRIKEKCKESEKDEVPVSIGLGVATKTEPEQNINDILKEADNEMYQNKLVESKSTKSKIVQSLLNTLTAKSNETKEHAVRMTKLAVDFGEKLDLSNSQMHRLSLLATLHDIGKTTIPKAILKKPGKLTDEEWKIVKEHSKRGYKIASASEEFALVADDILSHHEKWNGSGYPNQLVGKDIPYLARIISIIDAYDVMTNARSYSKAMSRENALKEIKDCAGSQFDPTLSEYFIEMMEKE